MALSLRLPFRLGTFWRLGNPGSFYGEGYHVGNSYYAIDFNRCNPDGSLIEDWGEDLLAVFDGRCVSNYIDAYGGMGLWIENDQGYRFQYHHLSGRSPVQEGQQVNVGDFVGDLGTSGLSNGPHIHAVLRNASGVSVRMEFEGVESPLWNTQVVEVKAVASPPVEKFVDDVTGAELVLGFLAYYKDVGNGDMLKAIRILGRPMPVEINGIRYNGEFPNPETGRQTLLTERGVLEYFSANPPPWDIQGMLLGREYGKRKGWI